MDWFGLDWFGLLLKYLNDLIRKATNSFLCNVLLIFIAK